MAYSSDIGYLAEAPDIAPLFLIRAKAEAQVSAPLVRRSTTPRSRRPRFLLSDNAAPGMRVPTRPHGTTTSSLRGPSARSCSGREQSSRDPPRPTAPGGHCRRPRWRRATRRRRDDRRQSATPHRVDPAPGLTHTRVRYGIRRVARAKPVVRRRLRRLWDVCMAPENRIAKPT